MGSRKRKEHQHGLGKNPSRDKPENLAGRGIKPLCVIDDTQQRTLQRHLSQQAERRQGHQEAVRSVARHQAERHSQRVLLRIRKTSTSASIGAQS